VVLNCEYVPCDDEVAAGEAAHGWRDVVESCRCLDAAGREATILATEESRPWMIVHADLPLVTPDDILAAARALAGGGSPIAPSDDGGTSQIGGRGPFSFSYCRASFHPHLALAEHPLVIDRRALGLERFGQCVV